MRVCHGLMTHPLILCSFLKRKEVYPSFLLVQLLLQFLHAIAANLKFYVRKSAKFEDKLSIPCTFYLDDVLDIDEVLSAAAKEHLGIQFILQLIQTLGDVHG